MGAESVLAGSSVETGLVAHVPADVLIGRKILRVTTGGIVLDSGALVFWKDAYYTVKGLPDDNRGEGFDAPGVEIESVSMDQYEIVKIEARGAAVHVQACGYSMGGWVVGEGWLDGEWAVVMEPADRPQMYR